MPSRLFRRARRPLLLALDIDGTLLRRDGSIAAADREAIAGAPAAGVTVTLATGRLSAATLPLARELGIDAPLVCADGAAIFCPKTEAPLALITLPSSSLSRFVSCLNKQELAPFLFTHHAAHGSPGHAQRFPFIAGWTPDVVACDNLLGVLDGPSALRVVTAIGLGPERAARQAQERLFTSVDSDDEVVTFPIGTTDNWVVRLGRRGCSKAVGLADVANRLAIGVSDVAAVGDWFNDIPMLAWAGHSFAMGQAPADVRSAAKHRLRATSETGGAVAEALAWLAENR
jgi:hydroxymethylpyrimidine pyrophosphatase-like HAD family hydrolase